MNEDTLNMEVRSFLKQVGVTSQREIEKRVHEAVEAGDLAGDETLTAEATVHIEELGFDVTIDDTIALE